MANCWISIVNILSLEGYVTTLTQHKKLAALHFEMWQRSRRRCMECAISWLLSYDQFHVEAKPINIWAWLPSRSVQFETPEAGPILFFGRSSAGKSAAQEASFKYWINPKMINPCQHPVKFYCIISRACEKWLSWCIFFASPLQIEGAGQLQFETPEAGSILLFFGRSSPWKSEAREASSKSWTQMVKGRSSKLIQLPWSYQKL